MDINTVLDMFEEKYIHAAVMLAPDNPDAVLAAWLRMTVLALRDPEGCVRVTPGLPMGPAEIAEYFRLPPETAEQTVTVLKQLGLLTEEPDGSLKLERCAAWREAAARRSGKLRKKTGAAADTGDLTEKETEKEKRKEAKEKSKEKNIKADIADAISKGARRPHNRPIPLAELPEPVRNIVTAWNGLPLDNKFDGLFPAMLKQAETLLERFGEEALRKAIDNVSCNGDLTNS